MILNEIVAAKRRELARAQVELPLSELEKRISQRKPALDFASTLRVDNVSIIAEVKKASPSKGLLSPNFDPLNLANAYAQGGATAISVLTETSYFQGALRHLSDIRKTPSLDKIPLLRKDFLFSPYQVYESRAFGADAILLIAAILTDEELEFLISLAHELGMQCLVEVHDRPELERVIRSPARIIGINNRDLRTFDVDIATTERLCPLVPEDRLIVSESGIKERKDIQRLKQCGVNAVLIGEALVTASDVSAKLREFT